MLLKKWYVVILDANNTRYQHFSIILRFSWKLLGYILIVSSNRSSLRNDVPLNVCTIFHPKRAQESGSQLQYLMEQTNIRVAHNSKQLLSELTHMLRRPCWEGFDVYSHVRSPIWLLGWNMIKMWYFYDEHICLASLAGGGVALFGWLCSQSRGDRKPTSGRGRRGRTTQTILFRINFDQQSKRARPKAGHNRNHDHDLDRDHDQITRFSQNKFVEFWILPTFCSVQHLLEQNQKWPSVCNDGFVNGTIYERSNFGRCSLLINGSPQWENKCWSGKWLGPDRLMEG